MKALHDYKNKRRFGHSGMTKPYFVDAKDGRLKFVHRNPRAVFHFKCRIRAY